MDLLDHLMQEHRRAESLMTKLSSSEGGDEREATLTELDEALTVHMAVEERFLYPVVQRVMDDETTDEAENEHELARNGLATLWEMVDQPGFGAAVDMVRGAIDHHVTEEEEEIFPKLREQAADEVARMDPEELEAQVRADLSTRDELYQRAREAGIEGRSSMTKSELAAALGD